MCVETSARIDCRTHEKYIEVKAHLTHTCPQFPVPVTQPRKTHPQITSPRRKQLRRSLSCPKTHKFPLSSNSLPSPRHIIQHYPHRHPIHRFISHYYYYYYNSSPISLSLSFHIPIHSPIPQPQKWNFQQLFPPLAFQANPNTSTHSFITSRSLRIVSISSLVLCSCINLSHKYSI
jgi:hypothetical protein